MGRFEGKTVLISGGAGGQGVAHLRAYVAEGANVVIGDIRDEAASRLWQAGVSTELHVHPGYPHAFDILLLGDPAGRRHQDEKVRIIREI